MKERVISAIVMLIIFIPLLLIGSWPFYIFITVLGMIAIYELLRLKKNLPLVIKIITYLLTAFIILSNVFESSLLIAFDYRILTILILVYLLMLVFINNQEKYNYKIVSTDNIKRRIYKDSKYNVKHLFEIQKIELETLMKKNCLIVADSNNSKKTYRNDIIKLANKYNYKYYSIYIESGLEDVKERLIKDSKNHILNNLDFYINEIELDDIDFSINNNNTNNYYNFIDKVMIKINEKN